MYLKYGKCTSSRRFCEEQARRSESGAGRLQSYAKYIAYACRRPAPDSDMFYLKYLTMHGHRIYKQRRFSRPYANAQPRLSFRCLR